MAKEIVTFDWCDVCLDESRGGSIKTPALPNDGSFSIGGLAPMDVDLCERHDKELVEPLRLLLAEFGRKPHGLAAAPVEAKRFQGEKTEVCLVPDCGKGYTTRSSLGSHVGRVHDLTMADYAQTYETDRPVDEEPLTCPECGKEFGRPEYTLPSQARGIHRAKTHGVKSEQPKASRARAERQGALLDA